MKGVTPKQPCTDWTAVVPPKKSLPAWKQAGTLLLLTASPGHSAPKCSSRRLLGTFSQTLGAVLQRSAQGSVLAARRKSLRLASMQVGHHHKAGAGVTSKRPWQKQFDCPGACLACSPAFSWELCGLKQ